MAKWTFHASSFSLMYGKEVMAELADSDSELEAASEADNCCYVADGKDAAEFDKKQRKFGRAVAALLNDAGVVPNFLPTVRVPYSKRKRGRKP